MAGSAAVSVAAVEMGKRRQLHHEHGAEHRIIQLGTALPSPAGLTLNSLIWLASWHSLSRGRRPWIPMAALTGLWLMLSAASVTLPQLSCMHIDCAALEV